MAKTSPQDERHGYSREKEKRQAMIDEREKKLLINMCEGLGLAIRPEQVEPLLETMSQVVFGRVVAKIENMFETLAGSLGADIGRILAGEAGHFAVTGRRYDDWIQCDNGSILIEPGKTFSLRFISGLEFDIRYDPEAEDDSFRFNAAEKNAGAVFGPPVTKKFHPLEISLGPGERSVPSLLFFFEAQPQLVSSKETLLRMSYNIFRKVDVDLNQWKAE